MKIKNRILASILSLCLMCGMMLPAYAAPEPVMTETLEEANSTATADVLLTAEASTFNVSVPTCIPIFVNADGTVTCPLPRVTCIYNSGTGAVKVTKIDMNNGTWTLASFNGGNRDKLAQEKVDANKLGFQLSVTGDSVETVDGGSQTLEHDASKWTINPNDSLQITTAAIATAVSGAIYEGEPAANVVFTIGWNAAA